MSALVGDECKDLGHAWMTDEGGSAAWWIVWRWMGRGESRRWSRVAERAVPCARVCGAIAVDRADPFTLRLIGRRKITYTKPDYLRQELNGAPATRIRSREHRLAEQAKRGALLEWKE